jgi:hypothetical protein
MKWITYLLFVSAAVTGLAASAALTSLAPSTAKTDRVPVILLARGQ